MTAFVPGRLQEASPTIRGFFYQVQQTLARWLDLAAGDTLILECGEDVDRVIRAADGQEGLRELEQIKSRRRRITLRDADALTALANFATHLAVNPSLSLRFRFTTTAEVGRERRSPLPNRLKGIELWERLRLKHVWSPSEAEHADQLATLLRTSTRPSDCPPKAWSRLVDILEGRGALPFEKFVRQYEWSCGRVGHTDLRSQLLDRLETARGGAETDVLSAEARYEQLLTRIWVLLSTDGSKQLTRADLNAAIARPTLTEQDRTRIRSLEAWASGQDARLTGLEAAVRGLSLPSLPPILFGEPVASLHSLDGSLKLPGPPPLVQHLAQRTQTVDALSARLSTPSWLAIHGAFGTGKSHLGFLLSRKLGGVVLGATFRGLDARTSEHAILRVLAHSAFVSHLSGAAVGAVLLDDLPDFQPRDRFESVLITLVDRVVRAGRVVISTSRRRLPGSVESAASVPLLQEHVPAFVLDEAKELFLSHGLEPAFLTDVRLAALNGMCSGNPVLLTALARHMADRKQDPSKAMVQALLANKHRLDVDVEITRTVLETVERAECRELLYRLAAINCPLTQDEVRVIASVAPTLPEAGGCLARLEGLWLRRTDDNHFEVSPLVAPLGNELAPGVARGIHKQAAAVILKRKSIGVIELTKAVVSFLVAGEVASAVALLLQGFMKVPPTETGFDAIGILLFFPLDRSSRLAVLQELPLRAAQAVTAEVTGADSQGYLARVRELGDVTSAQSAFGALMAGSMLLTSVGKVSMRLAVVGASLVEAASGHASVPKELGNDGALYKQGVHFLLACASLKSWDDLELLVELLGSLAPERRRVVVTHQEFQDNWRVLVFRPLFNATLGITPDALDRLKRIMDRCAELGMARAGAYAAAGRLVVYGEYEKDLDRVRTESAQALERFAGEPSAVAIIEATTGQQFVLNGRPAEGLPPLTRALAEPNAISGLERVERLADALIASVDTVTDCDTFATELETALNSGFIEAGELRCQLHAQLGIVRWREGNQMSSYLHLQRAVEEVLTLGESVRRRHFAAGLVHTLTYFVAILEKGSPPAESASGEAFSEPHPSFFTGTNSGMAGTWRDRQGPSMLRWLVARLAHAVGADAASEEWMDDAWEGALELRIPALLMMLAPRAIANALATSDWRVGVDAALSSGRALVFLDEVAHRGEGILDHTLSFDPLVQPQQAEQRSKAEERSLWHLSHAIVYVLGPTMSNTLEVFRSRASELATTIDEAAINAELKTVWAALADVLRLSAAEAMADDECRDCMRRGDATSAWESVRFVAHGLLGLRSDCRLEQAAASQVGGVQHAQREADLFGPATENYIVAVAEFWARAVEQSAFRFSSPREVRDLIQAAASQPPVERARATLRAVGASLGLRFEEATRLWLSPGFMAK